MSRRPVEIEIDSDSGFCFGVVTAINKAEQELAKGETLFCLGDIVHNSDEVDRLRNKGLVTITHARLSEITDAKVLLRAHGEPPSTYKTAARNNITIIDVTCPVVLALQRRIKETCDNHPDAQIVIYGKHGHAEVNGLVGQTLGRAIVIENESELSKINPDKDVYLFSQTTKSLSGMKQITSLIAEMLSPGVNLYSHDTICRQVANRADNLRRFAASHCVVLFVAGAKSSNGKVLYGECLSVNPRTHLVANSDAIDPVWLKDADSIGICGATSTPRWLMEEVRDRVATLVNHT